MNVDVKVSTEPVPRTTARSGWPLLTSKLGGRVVDEVDAPMMELVDGSLRLENVFEGNSDVMCVRYSQDGCLLAAGFADGYVRLYSVDRGQCLYAMVPTELMKLPVTCVRFYPLPVDSDSVERSHILAASYASGHVRLWHYSSRRCLYALDDDRDQTLSMSFSPPGDRFATVGADPKVFLYDVETKKRIAELEATDSRDRMDGHRARVFAVVYHPDDDHILLTGGWDDTVQFWDDRQRHAFRKIAGPHICGDSLDIDPVQNHVLTGSWRRGSALQIWDFASAVKLKDVPEDVNNASQLYCAQWLGQERIVCGGCFTNMARVVDRGSLNTSGQVTQLAQGVYCIDNDRQGSKPRIAVGSAHKVYQLKFTT